MINTAGEFKKYLSPLLDDMEITFGSSKFTKRPLVFYRCKVRGDNIIQIELSELDDKDQEQEYINRKTIKFFREYFQDVSDTTEIVFSYTSDTKELFLESISFALSLNFEQK